MGMTIYISLRSFYLCVYFVVPSSNAVPDIHFLYLIVPSGVFPESALADIFKPLEKKFGAKPMEKHAIFVCHRHDHCPVLFVRKAR